MLDVALCQGAHAGPQHREAEPKRHSAVSQSRRARGPAWVAEAAGKCRTGYKRGASCERVNGCLRKSIQESVKEGSEKTDQQVSSNL